MQGDLDVKVRLLGENRDLVAKMAQARQATESSFKAQADAIAAASGTSVKHVKAATAAIEAEQKKQAAAQEKAASAFQDQIKGAAGFAVAAGGVAVGAAAIHAAMSRVAEVTQQANQAQFALNATYKSSASIYAQAAAQQAEATRRTVAEVQQAITVFGSLSKRYALDSEQIKELTKRSADLAAVKGITTVEAAQRLEGALRGEAEAAEFLGLTLNSDYMKKFADMTAEQRKNWETLDPLTKAQITYREVLKQTNEFQGTAAARAKDASGAYDNLKTSSDNLALSIGKNVNPTAQASVGWLDALIDRTYKLIEANRKLQQEQGLSTPFAADAPSNYPGARIIDTRDIDSGRHEGQDVLDAATKRRREAAETKALVVSQLDEIAEASKAQADLEIDDIDRVRKEKEKWYGEERTRIEARRTYMLEDIEKRRDAEIKALEETARAQEKAFQGDIERAERRKALDIDTAEEAHRQVVEQIEQRERELKASRETEDREVHDAREQEERDISDARQRQDREQDDYHQAALRRIDEGHKERMAALDAEKEAEQDRLKEALRGIEEQENAARAASQKRQRRLDDEKKKVQDNLEAALRGIEEQEVASEKAHKAALKALDDEEKAAQTLHDENIKKLELEEQAAEQIHAKALSRLAVEEQAAEDEHNQQLARIELEEQAAEQIHDTRLQEIEDEAEAGRDAHESRLKEIAALADAEDERHRLAVDAIDEERNRQKSAVDEQIKALDALDRAERGADRLSELQRQAEEARAAVKVAQGNGTPEEIAAIRGSLSFAYRRGDSQAIKQLEQDLAAAAGHGTEAVEEARQKLADAEKAIADEMVKQQRDAEKQRLQAVKEGIDDQAKKRRDDEDEKNRQRKAELKAQEDQEDALYAAFQKRLEQEKEEADEALARERLRLREEKDLADANFAAARVRIAQEKDAEDLKLAQARARLAELKTAEDQQLAEARARIAAKKEAEDAAYDRAKERFDEEKQQARDAADVQIDAIGRREQADKDSLQKTLERLAERKLKVRDEADANIKAIDDRRTKEQEATAAAKLEEDTRFTEEQRRRDDTRLDEDRQRADRKTAEDRARSDKRLAEDQALKDQRDAADLALATERAVVEEHYNGTNGVITKLKKAMSDAKEEHRLRLEDAQRKYEDERKAASLVFTNPEKTGLLDMLEKARNDEFDKLEKSKGDWGKWREAVQKEVKDAKGDLDAFIKRLEELGWDGKFVPTPGAKPPEQASPPGGGDPGGNAAYAPVVKHASSDSYWTSGGTHGGHPAADIFADIGEPIYAPIGGRSRPATYPLGGNTTMLDGDDGRSYYFAHGNIPFEGGKVKKGERIGEVGNTGNARGTKPHLHFAISSQGSGLFGDLNGSGDVNGDASWWTTGASMGPGTTPGGEDQQEIEVTLLGHKFRIRVPADQLGSGGIDSYEDMVKLLRPVASKFGVPAEVMAAIGGNEAGFGEKRSRLAKEWHNWFGVKGEGDAGQTPPLWTWEDDNGNGREDPGEQIQQRFAAYSSDPAAFSVWAKQFSTGRYADAKAAYQRSGKPIDFLQGLFDAGYATDADWVRKVRSIGGFQHGGWIPEPTLLVSERTGMPYARAGEVAPEWVGPVRTPVGAAAGGPGGGGDTIIMNGVQPESMFSEAKRRQRRQAYLRGRSR